MKHKIFLIGMPGSGKSFFGNRLKEYFDYPMIDLDKEIEAKEGTSITEIFALQGEEYFRKVEAQLLREISERHETLILSTGGGTPCFHDGISYMNETGITIFLETPKDVLIERLSRKSHRPLMRGDVEKSVDDLLSKRLKHYQQADITIDHRDPDLLVELIKKLKS